MRTLLRISCLLAIFSGVYLFYKIQTTKRKPANKPIQQQEAPTPKGPQNRLTD